MAGGREKYTVFHRELGDARVPLHGVIAVVMLVRTEDVEDGAFQINRGSVNRVAAGVSGTFWIGNMPQQVRHCMFSSDD